MVTSS
jgi:hypothetical protein